MVKRFLSSYLNFTKKERTGTLIVLFLIGVCLVLPFLFPFFIKPVTTDAAVFKKQIETLKTVQADSAGKYYKKGFTDETYQGYNNPYNRKQPAGEFRGELFNFDPNTLDAAGWQRLGVKDKTVATIQKFVAKGGHFYKPEDIGKIWGLHEDEVKRLMPFVQIAATAPRFESKKEYENKPFTKPSYTPSVIDINAADTTALIALPGIGSKLSQRILAFRDRLGGFYKVEQIGETFGLPDSTFQKIKPRFLLSNTNVRQININTATLDEMKAHPYLRYAIANAVLQYRVQHGNYAVVTDIKKVMLVTEEIYAKVFPYLKVE